MPLLSDVPIDTVEEKEFQRVWKLYSQCFKDKNHFNQIQSEYRKLASTWLLAAFGAIGYIMTIDITRARAVVGAWFDPLLAISLVGLLAAIGIAMLWNLDLQVYHRLLQSSFCVGLDLEKRYPWLPPICHSMMVFARMRGVEGRVAWFYMVGIIVPIMISTFSICTYILHLNYELLAAAMLIAGIIICSVLCWWIRRSSGSASFDWTTLATKVKGVRQEVYFEAVRVRSSNNT